MLYAEAFARKIQLNPTFDLVREATRAPYTDPLVTVAIRSDGSIESISFVRRSGVPQLDDAIERVVRSLERYPAFRPRWRATTTWSRSGAAGTSTWPYAFTSLEFSMADDGSTQSPTVWPLPKFHFRVTLDGVSASFSEVSGLSAETQPIEYRAGDSKTFSVLKMPGLKKVSDVTLKRGVTTNPSALIAWIQSSKLNEVQRKPVTIELIDEGRRHHHELDPEQCLSHQDHGHRPQGLGQRGGHREPGAGTRRSQHQRPMNATTAAWLTRLLVLAHAAGVLGLAAAGVYTYRLHCESFACFAIGLMWMVWAGGQALLLLLGLWGPLAQQRRLAVALACDSRPGGPGPDGRRRAGRLDPEVSRKPARPFVVS